MWESKADNRDRRSRTEPHDPGEWLIAPERTFDPVAFKNTTREQWQRAAAAWYRWTPVLQRWLDPVAETMLRLARIGAGNRVLDVAAGTGEPALSAAVRVGPSGYVLATDISANILAFAEQVARDRGLTNVEARVMDGENLELPDASFDAVLSRLGLIYFPDRDRGLAEMYRVLRPGGRVVVASFTSPEANRFFSIPISIIRRRAQLAPPIPGQPGPFSLGAPGALESALQRAHFESVETHIIQAPLRLGSAAECVRFERESFGALQQMLAGLPETEQQAAWEEVESEMRSLEGSAGFEAETELIVGSAIKPSSD